MVGSFRCPNLSKLVAAQYFRERFCAFEAVRGRSRRGAARPSCMNLGFQCSMLQGLERQGNS